MAKISDLNKKQYNYKHEFYGTEETRCQATSGMLADCADNENIDLTDYSEYTSSPPTTSITTTCKNLYSNLITTIKNKDIFDRFLTALILSLIVCLANIGLALFGFLLFRTPGDF